MEKQTRSIIFLERRGQDLGSFEQNSRMPGPRDSSQEALAVGIVEDPVTLK